MKPDLVSVQPLPPAQMTALGELFSVHKLPPPQARAAFLGPIADRVRFIQTTGFIGADRALIEALPKLEIIGCMGVGVDAIDLKTARERGVKVTNTPDVLNDCVADLAMGMIVAGLRRLPQSDRHVRSLAWRKGEIALARKVSGKRLGILGLGRIGKAIAKRALGFDMEIGYHGRRRQDDAPYAFHPDLVEMARWADVLMVICPGGPATRNLVGRAVVEALGPEGLLVNVSRGSVVDEPALVQALKEGKLGSAALDVFADEPNVPADLIAMDNVVLTPHIGSATIETRKAMADLVVDNLRAHLEGRKLLTPVI